MPFTLVVGKSTVGPEEARDDAERQASAIHGGEQISVAACVVPGAYSYSASDPETIKLLDNLARNIYQLVQCTCTRVEGNDPPGAPVPLPAVNPNPTWSPGLWVVYILVKHR